MWETRTNFRRRARVHEHVMRRKSCFSWALHFFLQQCDEGQSSDEATVAVPWFWITLCHPQQGLSYQLFISLLALLEEEVVTFIPVMPRGTVDTLTVDQGFSHLHRTKIPSRKRNSSFYRIPPHPFSPFHAVSLLSSMVLEPQIFGSIPLARLPSQCRFVAPRQPNPVA